MATVLKGEKGINLSDTVLNLPSLTAKDREDLKFPVQHGDLVVISFVQRPEDIEQLVHELTKLQTEAIGIILKIEIRLVIACKTTLRKTWPPYANCAFLKSRRSNAE